jgi:hypothetical protein
MAMKGFSGRSACVYAAAVAALILLRIAPGLAAETAERPYNPPVGSRWIIESEANSDQARTNRTETVRIKTRAELTIDAKTVDGFKITYINRGTTVEGTAASLELLRSWAQAQENVAIHATTDLAGKPLNVDNLDEAKGAMRNMTGALTAPYQDKPELLAVFKQMISRFDVDAGKAALVYIGDLAALAKAQNTGMTPGEVRRASHEVDSPLGGGSLKSNETFEMMDADIAAGQLKYVETVSYDAASLKDFTQSFIKRLTAASGAAMTPERIDSLYSSLALSLDQRTEFEVEDGMTRKITTKKVTGVRVMGQNSSKTETSTITVTPAP